MQNETIKVKQRRRRNSTVEGNEKTLLGSEVVYDQRELDDQRVKSHK